jgi:hypothetical protein
LGCTTQNKVSELSVLTPIPNLIKPCRVLCKIKHTEILCLDCVVIVHTWCRKLGSTCILIPVLSISMSILRACPGAAGPVIPTVGRETLAGRRDMPDKCSSTRLAGFGATGATVQFSAVSVVAGVGLERDHAEWGEE